MAYILGFILADGCVRQDNRVKNCKYLCFTLAERDNEILEFISQEISPGHKIIHRTVINNDRNTSYRKVHLSIYSVPLVDDLNRHGIVSRKTGSEQVPYIPDEYRPDFIRGLFDGDGCYVCRNRGKYRCFGMYLASASEQFLEDVRKTFFFDIGAIRKYSKSECYSWQTDSVDNILKIGHYMYNGNFCLKRKHDKFLEVVNHRMLRK